MLFLSISEWSYSIRMNMCRIEMICCTVLLSFCFISINQPINKQPTQFVVLTRLNINQSIDFVQLTWLHRSTVSSFVLEQLINFAFKCGQIQSLIWMRLFLEISNRFIAQVKTLKILQDTKIKNEIKSEKEKEIFSNLISHMCV